MKGLRFPVLSMSPPAKMREDGGDGGGDGGKDDHQRSDREVEVAARVEQVLTELGEEHILHHPCDLTDETERDGARPDLLAQRGRLRARRGRCIVVHISPLVFGRRARCPRSSVVEWSILFIARLQCRNVFFNIGFRHLRLVGIAIRTVAFRKQPCPRFGVFAAHYDGGDEGEHRCLLPWSRRRCTTRNGR